VLGATEVEVTSPKTELLKCLKWQDCSLAKNTIANPDLISRSCLEFIFGLMSRDNRKSWNHRYRCHV